MNYYSGFKYEVWETQKDVSTFQRGFDDLASAEEHMIKLSNVNPEFDYYVDQVGIEDESPSDRREDV